MLITAYLSMKAPVFIAPAMDLDMYAHPSTQQNLKTLQGYGNHIIEPQSGFLASGLEGKGRMEEPERIVEFLDNALSQTEPQKDLAGKSILITAGPTYEKIDPVRFIGNYSSGKMGFALAAECARRGADVTLVAGPVSLSTPEGVNRIDVESCQETVPEAVTAFLEGETTADQKIKREKDDLVLRLQPTHDIAQQLGTLKTDNQVLVGFALETNDEEVNAKKKLAKKNLDFIVLNSTRNKGTTFRSDDNQISIISANGQKDFPKKPKTEVARDIVDELAALI